MRIARIRINDLRIIVQIILLFLLNFTFVGGLIISCFLPILRLTAAVNPFLHIMKEGEMQLCMLGTVGRCFTSTWPWTLLLPVLGGCVIVCGLAGRALCGWACPFGFIQDLLDKLRGLKFGPKEMPISWHEHLLALKYLLLFLFALLAVSITISALASKYAGTLFKGCWPGLWQVNPFCALCFPISVNTLVHLVTSFTPQMLSPYVVLQLLILLILFTGPILTPRFWCRYLCWVGAVGSLFNKISFLSVRRDTTTCTHCGYCLRACNMRNEETIEEREKVTDLNCILCLSCVESCPNKSLALYAGRRILYRGGKPWWRRL